MPDTITPPKTTPSASRGGNWFSQHRGLTIGGGLAAALVLYLVIRSRNKSASQQPNQSTATAVPQYPYSTGVSSDTNFGDYYAGLLNSNQALANQVSQLGTGLLSAINANQGAQNPSTNPTNNGSPSGSSQPAAAPNNQGYGVVNTAQGPMVWLGVLGPNSPIYNVGGGAPVFFGNSSSLSQGPGQEHSGQDVYTPTSYENLVASSPQPWTGPL